MAFMPITPENIIGGSVVVLIFFLWVMERFFGGFISRAGEMALPKVLEILSSLGIISSEDGDERLFTGSNFEKELIEEIDDLNPLRDTEIHCVDYNYESGGSLILEYSTKSRDRLKVRGEIENIAYAFSSAIQDENNPCGEMVVTVLNENKIPIAEYHINREWAESFNEGEIDDIEYINNIMEVYEWLDEDNRWDD